MQQERTPLLGRESKPLRSEEYPSQEDVASLTGEVGASRVETALRLGMMVSALAGPALAVACEQIPETPVVRTPEEAGVPTPTEVLITPIPTEKPIPPTPTVVQREIGTIPRELGGAESEIFSISYNGETQQGVLNKFPDGGRWMLLAVYPDLPEVEEKVDFSNEAVSYDGMFFLTAVPALEDYPNALPFYQKEPEEGFPNGVLLYIKDGEIIARVDPFAYLQEGEVSVRFDSEKGVYEFLDEAGNVTRTIEVFTVPEPEEPVEMVATGNVDLYLSPDGEKVGYFIPGQTFIPTGTEQDGWIEVEDSDGNILWIEEGSAYIPLGQATPTPEATPIPEVTPTTEPTPPPTPEVVPSNEICAVGELEGQCYQRTPLGGWRSGVKDGRPFPDGSVRHHTADPDLNFQGSWVIGGRVEKIDLGQNLIHLRGRGEDIIIFKVWYDNPYFYSRMRRTPDCIPCPWREGMPEVRPILGRDIISGDYLEINICGPGVDIKNWKTSDENYQALMEALKRQGEILTVAVEIYQ